MISTMTHKGYFARIEYDDEDGTFTGRIAGIRDEPEPVGQRAAGPRGERPYHEVGTRRLERCNR